MKTLGPNNSFRRSYGHRKQAPEESISTGNDRRRRLSNTKKRSIQSGATPQFKEANGAAALNKADVVRSTVHPWNQAAYFENIDLNNTE